MSQNKQAILFLAVTGCLLVLALIRLPGLLRHNTSTTGRLFHEATLLSDDPKPHAAGEARLKLLPFLAAEPLDLGGHLLLARMEQRLGRINESWQALARAELARPFDTRPPFLLGVLMLENGRLKEGLFAYRRSLRLGTGQLQEIFQHCHAIFNGQYELFRFIFPDQPGLNEELGILLRDAGMVRQSIEAFQQALRRSPGEVRLLEKIAVEYAELHEYGEALKSIERALELNPDKPRLTYRKAAYLLGHGETEQSITLCRSLLAADPEYAQAYRLLSRCYASRGETGNEVQTIKSALQRVARKSLFHQQLGDCYRREGRNDDALLEYEQGLKTAADNYERKFALYRTGRCLLKMGRPADALRVLEEARAIPLSGADKPGALVEQLIESIRGETGERS